MGAVVEVRSPFVGMFFLMRRVVARGKDGYQYKVRGGGFARRPDSEGQPVPTSRSRL